MPSNRIAKTLVATTALLLLLAPSCKKKDAPPPTPALLGAPGAPPAGVRATPQAPPTAPTAQANPMPGALDEASFKALHELKPGAAPAPKGNLIDIGGGAKAYLSLPPNAKTPLPGVVVVHEWWGLNDHIKHWADRLAAEGYAALAVDLYEGKVASTPDQAMTFMKQVDHAKAAATMKAAHAFLASDARVQAKKRGAIGWCFGGRQVLNLAMAAPDLDAAVVYYGPPETDAAKLKSIKSPLLAIYANKDKHITPAAVDKLEAGLKTAGVNYRMLRYDADHAFANPSQKVYDEASVRP